LKNLDSFKEGLSIIINNKKIWVLFFIIQLLFSLVLVRPLAVGLDHLIGNSTIGSEILAGNGANILMEYITHESGVISAQTSIFGLMGIIYLIIMIYFKGGTIALFTRQEAFNPGRFSHFCGEFFGRFFRLFLISLLYFIAAFLLYLGIDALLSTIPGDSEPLIVLTKIIGFAFLLFLIFLIRMVIDYAKILGIRTNEKKMFRTSLKAWVFVFKHPVKTLGLFYFTGLFGLLIWAAYYFLGGLIPAAGPGIALIFIFQQIYAFVRNGVNLLFLSSQTVLMNRLSPLVHPVDIQEEDGK